MWTIPASTIPVAASELDPPDPYEDKYHRVKQERDATKKAFNQLEDDNRQLRTRCATLESAVKRKNAGAPSNAHLIDTFGSPAAFNKLQVDYEDLFRCYELQQREHRALIAKHKSCLDVLRKQKREIQSLKLRCGAHLNNRTTNTQRKQTGGCRKKVAEVQVEVPSADADKENVENAQHSALLMDSLQLRLNSAEAQLQTLKLSPPHEAGECGMLGSASQEVTTKLHLLQAQHELDESRIQAQSDKLANILRLHNEYKERHGACKKELEFYQEEVEALQIQVAELEESNDQVAELEEANRFLEEKVRQLCATLPPKERGHDRESERLEERLRVEENRRLREDNQQLNSQLQSLEEKTSKRLGEVWQQLDRTQQRCSQKEDELKDARQSLASQTQVTEQLRRELNSTISSQRKQIDDLSLKASQRLEKIRLLESQQQQLASLAQPMCSETSTPPLLTEGKNVLDVTLHGAALTGALSDNVKSFALIDFQTHGSELSDIVPGTSPTYNLTVSYEIDAEHRFLRDDFVRVEVYLLRNEAAPELFASASTSVSALLTPSGALHLPTLELTSAMGDEAVGSLSLSMRLAQPVSAKISAAPNSESRPPRRIVPDAIAITIEAATLSGKLTCGDASFYVHYRFLSFCDVLTSLERPNAEGVVTFQHKSLFPILSSDGGSLQQVFSSIAKGILHFTLYSSSDRSERQRFHPIGEAQVPLANIWGQAKIAADLVSLEAKLVGRLDIAFDTSVSPSLFCK